MRLGYDDCGDACQRQRSTTCREVRRCMRAAEKQAFALRRPTFRMLCGCGLRHLSPSDTCPSFTLAVFPQVCNFRGNQRILRYTDTLHAFTRRLPCVHHDERDCRCHPQTASEAVTPFALKPARKSLRSALEISSRRRGPDGTSNTVDSEGLVRLLLGCDADEAEARGHAWEGMGPLVLARCVFHDSCSHPC